MNKESIRNHTNQMLWDGEIFEIDVGYNAKGFITYLGYEQIKKDKELARIILSNTQYHIYKLKYPKFQESIPKRKKLTGRDYGSLTGIQERKMEKKRLKELKDSKI